MLERVAGALSYLHSHDPQIVHRDVKGGNVVISAGEPRLTDFGISTFNQSFTLTSENPGSGTAHFQAPETLRDDARADASTIERGTGVSGESGKIGAKKDDVPKDIVFDERRRELTLACDMYSFVCLCIEVYTLQLPWGELKDTTIVPWVLSSLRPPRPTGNVIPDPIWSLVQNCWPHEPQDRMTSDAAQEALRAMLNP